MKNAKIIAAAVALAFAIWHSAGVSAQRGPQAPVLPPPIPAGPAVKAGASGLFVLLGGTLLKYDPVTLTPAGSLELAPKAGLPDPPIGIPPNVPPPPIHAQMLISLGSPELVLVVINDRFFSVDAATMQIVAKTDLPKPEVGPPASETAKKVQKPRNPGSGPKDGAQIVKPLMPPIFHLELSGSTLYVIRGPNIIAININNGDITGQAELPKPPAPPGRN